MKMKAITAVAALLLLLGTAQARSSAEWNLKGANRSEGRVVLTLVSKTPELTPANRQARTDRNAPVCNLGPSRCRTER